MASGYEKSPEYGGREPKSREVLIGLVIAGLVVPMIERFMATDRAFSRARKRVRAS